MALIPPFFLDCVTTIGARDAQGNISFHATGFLYGRFLEKINETQSRYHVYLLTNRHVFERLRAAVLRFNPPPGKPARVYDVDLVDGTGTRLWAAHTDPTLDVAVIGINSAVLREHAIEFAYFQSDKHVLSRDKATATGLSEGDGIFVLGFPLGDPGGDRNYVVVRHGVIARVRDYLAGASKQILIDASIFPGNSGGPVVTRPQAMAITGTQAQTETNLLGIVSAYVPYHDIAYSKQTDRPRVIFEENTGLAVIVPIEYAIDVIERLEQERKEPPPTPPESSPPVAA